MSSYVYGVTRADGEWSPDIAGLEDAPVRRVNHERISALVSDLESEPIGRRREVLRHADVVGHALAYSDVLPLQFGTLLADDAAVVNELLDPRQDQLAELLGNVAGRVEVRLRGYYEEERIIAEILAEQPDLRRGSGSFSDRIRVGEHVAAGIGRHRAQDEAMIVERLRPAAQDVSLGEPTSELMALNSTFLLSREDLEGFDAAVAELGDTLSPRMQLKYAGPFPPVSFVDLQLEGGAPWDYSASS